MKLAWATQEKDRRCPNCLRPECCGECYHPKPGDFEEGGSG